MNLTTYVYRDSGKIYTFYIEKLSDGEMQVVGVHIGGIFHVFVHPDIKPRSTDLFDAVDYRRLVAKAKSKFGVAKVNYHRVHCVLIKDGKDFTVRAQDVAGQVTPDLVVDSVIKNVFGG